MKPIRTLVSLMVLSVFLFSACAAPAPAPPTPTLTPTLTPIPSGTPAAESSDVARPSFGSFTAPGIEGKDYTDELFERADLTMVNIWGTFCGPCIEEMPYLGELASEYKEKGFQIVGIVVDAVNFQGEYDKAVVSDAFNIIDKTGADYVHLLPSQDLINIKLNQVQYIPETVFVDKNGGVIGEPIIGSKSKEEWKQIIDAYLGLVQ